MGAGNAAAAPTAEPQPPGVDVTRPRTLGASHRLGGPHRGVSLRGIPTRLAAAVAAGLLLMLAFPPYGWWPCAALGVGLLALATRGVRPRGGALIGLTAGAAFFGPLLHWTGIYVGPLPWLILAATQAAYVAGLGALLALLSRLPLRWWTPGVALAWVLQEGVRDREPYGGFPWGRLGFSQADAPAAHLARWAGVPLVTAATALTGALLAAALVVALRGRVLPALGAALLAVLVAGLPAAIPVAPPSGKTVTIAVVQGNVPRLGLDFNAQREAVLRDHVTATHELAERVRLGQAPRPDLVIWPENSSDIDPFGDPSAYALITHAVREIGVPVLVGAVLSGPGNDVSNTGIVWDPRTGPASGPHGRYVKRHPVPFAEYIPMRSVARIFSSAVDRVQHDFAKGRTVGALDLASPAGTVRLADVICFEVGYDGIVQDAVRAGGSVLVVQTNNATFGRTPQTYQQLQMSRLRSLETGRWSLVAATSGVSAVVAPDGRVAQRTGVFTAGVLEAQVRLATPGQQTLATRVGPWPEAAMSGLALLVGVAAWRRRRALRGSPATTGAAA